MPDRPEHENPADSGAFDQSPLPDSNRRPLPYHESGVLFGNPDSPANPEKRDVAEKGPIAGTQRPGVPPRFHQLTDDAQRLLLRGRLPNGLPLVIVVHPDDEPAAQELLAAGLAREGRRTAARMHRTLHLVEPA